ncbi:hypothetical protein LVY75_00185 (plasmid) [Sinorhizobium sp. B11]
MKKPLVAVLARFAKVTPAGSGTRRVVRLTFTMCTMTGEQTQLRDFLQRTIDALEGNDILSDALARKQFVTTIGDQYEALIAFGASELRDLAAGIEAR